MVLVELEHVAGEVDDRPLAAGGVQAAAAEASDPAVVFVVTEDRFDQAGALFVGGGALGCAQEVLHFLDRRAVWWRAGGVAELAGSASLFVVFLGGDQPVRAGAGEVVL